MVPALGEQPPTVLIPYLPAIRNVYQRCQIVQTLAAQKKWDSVTRETLVDLVGDATANIRGAACTALAKTKLQGGEIETLEHFLTRKTSDLRQGVLGLLLQQADAAALASADRLAASKDTLQRLAGLEILRQLAASNRQRAACQARAAAYQTTRKKLSDEERGQIEGIAATSAEQVTLDDALGLMDPAERSPVVPPKARKVQFLTEAAVKCIQSLDDLVHEHRETPVKYKRWRGEETEELLGNIQYGFPAPQWDEPPQKSTVVLPLAEVWKKWYAGRAKSLCDKDGLELVRAAAWLDVAKDDWSWNGFSEWGKGSPERKKVLEAISCGFKPSKLKYAELVEHLVAWLNYLHPVANLLDFLLDATETSFALVPETEIRKLAELPEETGYYYGRQDPDWRNANALGLWRDALGSEARRRHDTLTRQQVSRWWQLLRWQDEPFPKAARKRPYFSVLIRAYDHGIATRADVLDHLLGPDRRSRYGNSGFDSLAALTARKLDKDDESNLARRPEVREMVERCRARIVEVELTRGESPTAATAPAWGLGSLWGTDLLVRLMTALGKQGFKVPTGWQKAGKESKACTLTQLASITYPKPEETPEGFCRLVQEAVDAGRLSEQTVLELAFLAPQWVRHVESYLGWEGMAEALYWFLAHMRFSDGREDAAIGAGVAEDAGEDESDADKRKPSAWERLIAERTPLSDTDRLAGAVDVGWFRRIYAQLAPKRWLAMAEAAKLAANSAQARHAQFVADVLTGKARRKQLVEGVRRKKLKDHVRLLGLLPLAEGAKREADLIERYNLLQEYHRYARGLSAMTKPEALRSVEVGMQNLASTAGYADPLRLEWAMEAEQVKKLAAGPLTASKGGVTVTLALDEEAQPQLSVERAGKPLKSIPPEVKKDKRVAELAEQATHLKRQASRMKASLEAAMCRGDAFSGSELRQLCQHAILAPLLSRLVLVGEGIVGYPDRGGQALRDAAGKREPVKKNEALRIAHAHDLLAGGQWDRYQKECFQAERVQPFKQVFRELYVVTRQEQRDGTVSRRYAGQQVQPQQALALLGPARLGHAGRRMEDVSRRRLNRLGLFPLRRRHAAGRGGPDDRRRGIPPPR